MWSTMKWALTHPGTDTVTYDGRTLTREDLWLIPDQQLSLPRNRPIQTLLWDTSFYCLHIVFILSASAVCQSKSNRLPVWLGMRHKSHSATCVSPPQSLLHPQNAINVQPSFILIHSPLAQMKWIRNLVGQGRACRLPSVAELFSILLA